jgi:hypothetical protein
MPAIRHRAIPVGGLSVFVIAPHEDLDGIGAAPRAGS